MSPNGLLTIAYAAFRLRFTSPKMEICAIRQAEVLLGQLIFDIYAMFPLGSV